MISAGSVSSNLLDVETCGVRITFRMVAHTRLTARQKFSWWATGINLKFTTWMTRNEKYNKNKNIYIWTWKAWENLSGWNRTKNSHVFIPCGSPIKLMNFLSFGYIFSYPQRLESVLWWGDSVEQWQWRGSGTWRPIRLCTIDIKPL